MRPVVCCIDENKAPRRTILHAGGQEDWIRQPHIQPHVAKVLADRAVSERHLFLVPVSDVLGDRYMRDNFSVPTRTPRGHEGLDGLWLWSDYWNRFLRFDGQVWRWRTFPDPTGS